VAQREAQPLSPVGSVSTSCWVLRGWNGLNARESGYRGGMHIHADQRRNRKFDGGSVRIPGGGQAVIHLTAMFEGQAQLVAPEVKETHWEGATSDGSPCPGPELLSVDTQMALMRR
jgi:hypothetical protein